MNTPASIPRLDDLPFKVFMPFNKLITNGLLDEETVSIVLDAGELDDRASRDPSKLLAFAAGYLYLESKQLPIRDTIRMAKEQGRRLNLDWTAKRWKQEHDRLSRAAVLARLAGENVVYDVSRYDALLPPFAGYLIRSSRRLGMEGLRQRHCVASYHNQVNAGYCAIASVFVDRQRWTVSIALTGDAEAPLRISQIKTRFNEEPSNDIRKRIHKMLGIKITDTTPAGDQAGEHEYMYMDNLRTVLPVLRAHGIGSVTVEFDGYGDSGSIQSVTYDVIDFDDAAISVDVAVVNSVFENRRWVRTRSIKRMSLNDAIEALTYDYLSETHVNWYDNDGGYGELVIDVVEGTVSLDVNVRFTESHMEFGQTCDIETGEAI